MKNKQAAFTLIEILIVLAMLGILAAVAVPSFSNSIKNNRIQTQLRGFASHLKYARSESINTQRSVTVCHLTANVCDGQWSLGWTVFFDDDQDGELEIPADDKLKVFDGVGNNLLSVTNGAISEPLVRFDGRGRVNAAMTVKLCDEGLNINFARAILIEPSGMAVYSRINAATSIYKDITGADLTCP